MERLPPGLISTAGADARIVDGSADRGGQTVVRAIGRRHAEWRRAGDRAQCRRGQRDLPCRRPGARAGSAARISPVPAGGRVAQRARRRSGSRRSISGSSASSPAICSERLPHRNVDEPFSKLAVIVNGMLDEMETMIHALAGVGNDIAHDLRTPLTRARLALERGRTNATSLEQLQAVTDKAIAGIDQSLTIITALLRLAEIENSRRSAGFRRRRRCMKCCGRSAISMNRSPKTRISPCGFEIDAGSQCAWRPGFVDRGGRQPRRQRHQVHARRRQGRHWTAARREQDHRARHRYRPRHQRKEREAVLRRFYRSDKMRNTPGVGLGLNLVAAIVKLHGFRLAIHPGPGGRLEIICPDS